MTIPGLITGQPISGRQAGLALFNFLPSLPGEGPPMMPRFMAKALFPQGFQPLALPAAAVPVQPPVAAARPPAPAAVPQPPAPPAPAAAVPEPAPPKPLDRRILDPEMVTARSIRQVVKERRGML